ncbi:GntR family transcriptional regulator [Planobispora takensis]|uniref:Phosphonate metabolism transcriptional regulator PhnF n=1 Tax=Planobispora takensis TaxID=1367882 RepID=A0A8J3SZP9_9ACTN|nr:GntR family transcriptional regulator [Planobispora takensis]GII01771.1 phosphonate metabolism transcriptional regulator PhnF [Planobispora takensis]
MVEIKAPVSRWKQVADYLREQILTGAFPSGQPLPSEQQLADEFGLSRPTIRQAINELKSEGLVEVKRPRGTFVRSPYARPSQTEERGLTHDADGRYADAGDIAWRDLGDPDFYREDATVTHTELLGIPAGEPMLVRATVQIAGDARRSHKLIMPFSVATETPWADDPRLPEPGDLYAHFEASAKGLHWTEHVRARMPMPDEAAALNLLPGTPLLQVTRITHAGKTPVVMEEIAVRGDALEVSYPLPLHKTRATK